MRTPWSDTIAGFASVIVAKPLRVERVPIAKQWECAIPSPLPRIFVSKNPASAGFLVKKIQFRGVANNGYTKIYIMGFFV